MRSAVKNAKSTAKKAVKKTKKTQGKSKPNTKRTMTNAIEQAKQTIDAAVKWLKETNKDKLFLFEQNRNCGDVIHLTPIIHHYRIKHPEAAIAFVVAQPYHNAHEHNPHINKLYTIASLDPQARIELRKHMVKYRPQIEVIAPSIFPYGEVWKELAWSYPNIADQYFHNAGITDLKPLGGRKLILQTTDADRNWAAEFMRANGLKPESTVILEYTSYSQPVEWNVKKWEVYVNRLKHYGIKCVSVGGSHEGVIPGTIPAMGITWRQTAALCSTARYMTGCGSGITMIAAAANPQPTILEILISPSITMEGCGYAPSIRIVNPDPSVVADHLFYKIIKR